MGVFPFLHFFTACVYVYLAVYILLKNPKALVNRIVVLIFLSFGIWAFSMMFIHNPISSKATVHLFSCIGSIGWATFGGLFVWFMLAFSGKRELLRKKWLILLLVVVPLLFIYKQWTNFLFVDYHRVYFGWKPVYSRSIWPHLYYLYYVSFMAVGFYFSIDFMRKTPSPVLKKQVRIFLVSVMIAMVLGTLTDIVFPLLQIHSVPNIADIIILVWAFSVVYAMVRYKFLTITPATAADNILSTMFDCLILLNMKEEIVTVNKAVTEVSGYGEEELNGMPVSSLLKMGGEKHGPPGERLTEGELKNEDFILRSKEKKEVPVLLSSSVLRDESGAAAGIVCVAKDISERKRLEDEIFKSKKLESIGILAGGIAHDFNNLLTVIVGSISMALAETAPTDKVRRFLIKAEEVSLKAAELAEKFITFSPGGWVNREEVGLIELLDFMKASGLPGGDTVSYDIDVPPDLRPIEADEQQLIQVMQHLFNNAVEAMPGEGGEIRVRAENITFDAQNKFLLREGEYVKISVNDNGRGISPGIMDKIFDPYFSTKAKPNQKGLGLGLTICYSVIKKHDGHIEVESSSGSEMGAGTTFTLYLPAFTGK